MQYTIIIEKTGNGYSAYAPDLLGCIAAAETREETSQLMHEAIELHLEDMRATGQTIPQPTTFSELVEVA